ncbi:MAG: hypothetical protein QGH74_05210 [Candidatus Brocadiia bacterium]|jgi:hypothetical protein|nr:hypothetical protein [Candidatus Brocadiia bacterium]
MQENGKATVAMRVTDKALALGSFPDVKATNYQECRKLGIEENGKGNAQTRVEGQAAA